MIAVFEQLKKEPDVELRFWCDYKFGPQAKKIFAKFDSSIPVEFVFAGKFRRYHGPGIWFLLRPSILFANIVDLFKIIGGFFQSFFKLIRWRPDVIFIKGGFVCLPVGYAARILGIPIVLHDSDAHPGLTNRLLAPFASKIATGAPLEYYNYPKDKTTYVGIPISSDFRQYGETERRQFKQKLGFDENRQLVVATGGGLGAVRINNAVARERDILLEQTSLMLISGNDQYDELKNKLTDTPNWKLVPFVHQGMVEVLAAADIVVARAGATTLLELAALHKPTIIIPNEILTAGHQLKNAKVYQDALAAVIITEGELDVDGTLTRKITDLLNASGIRQELGDNFVKFAKPNAAKDVASLLVSTIAESGRVG